MRLQLEGISKRVGNETWLDKLNLQPQPGAMTVLLGATRAGKTSLMRVMAGLDTPDTGAVKVDGVDVTGVPVRRRNVAMVYQQFINYPSMTVAQNIASPLKLRGEKNVAARVRALAEKLHIESLLDRLPAELSGGQQQRVALARALAKDAPLVLLDEPLVNLDYKLREEMRDELTQVFEGSQSTVVYATTEPAEALLLGGYTAVMVQGQLLQYGPAVEVFERPANLRVAQAYSDPPMNFFEAYPVEQGVQLATGRFLPIKLGEGQAPYTLGLRAMALRLHARPADIQVDGKVLLAEISGSDTFLHLNTDFGDIVAQLTGVHHFELGAQQTLYFSTADLFAFGAHGALFRSPLSRS